MDRLVFWYNAIMENEKKILEKFYDFLISKGFPKDQILQQVRLADGKRVDIAIIDSDTKDIIAFFEVKSSKNARSEKDIINQLQEYNKTIGNEVQKYVVFGDNDQIKIYEAKDNSLEEIGSIPDYQSLEVVNRQAQNSKLQKTKTSTLDSIKIVCWGGFVLILLVIILDSLGIYKVTAERLALIGIAIALLIIPFSSKLKILGIEFEKFIKSKQ